MKIWMAVPVLVTALVAGCSQAPAYKLSDAERAKYAQIPPEELIATTEGRLKQAEKDELPRYAPVSFRYAKASLEEAVKGQQKRGAIEDVITNIAGANARLDAGYENKEKARTMLAPNIALDQRLQELQASKVAASDYKELVSDLNEIYEMVDSGEAAKAERNRTGLTKNQQALKIKLIKSQYLAELKQLHAKMDSDSDAKVVPLAVKEAVTAYRNLDSFIDGHSDDTAAIEDHVREATVLAQRARWMAARARLLANIDNDSTDVEKILVEEEKWLSVISAAVGGETVRHLPPEQQAAKLAERVRQLKAPAEPAAAPQNP